MSDLMREEFEEWHRSVVDGEPPHEKYSDGSYINPHVNRYWTGWQASRECLVIELPEEDDTGKIRWTSAMRSIESTGAKVKP